MAALAVIVITLGWAIGGAPRNTPSRDLLLLLHRSVGLVILAAMLFRVGWRWIHPAPAMPENNRLSQAAIAFHLVGQYLVYLFVALRGRVAPRHRQTRRCPRADAAAASGIEVLAPGLGLAPAVEGVQPSARTRLSRI